MRIMSQKSFICIEVARARSVHKINSNSFFKLCPINVVVVGCFTDFGHLSLFLIEVEENEMLKLIR